MHTHTRAHSNDFRGLWFKDSSELQNGQTLRVAVRLPHPATVHASTRGPQQTGTSAQPHLAHMSAKSTRGPLCNTDKRHVRSTLVRAQGFARQSHRVHLHCRGRGQPRGFHWRTIRAELGTAFLGRHHNGWRHKANFRIRTRCRVSRNWSPYLLIHNLAYFKLPSRDSIEVYARWPVATNEC